MFIVRFVRKDGQPDEEYYTTIHFRKRRHTSISLMTMILTFTSV